MGATSPVARSTARIRPCRRIGWEQTPASSSWRSHEAKSGHGHAPARLRAVRQTLRMSQADLARAVREAGARAGEPNGCTASQVRRWESGTTALPHPRYLKALEMVTGQPAENLGFRADERYGLDASALGMRGEDAWLPETEPRSAAAPLTGIWL